MTRRQRYTCQDCLGPCSRGAARCKPCAARATTRRRGYQLLARPSRDEDYRPTGVELARVDRLLRRLRLLRRYRRRSLTVEEVWSQQPLPVDREYATVAGGRS